MEVGVDSQVRDLLRQGVVEGWRPLGRAGEGTGSVARVEVGGEKGPCGVELYLNGGGGCVAYVAEDEKPYVLNTQTGEVRGFAKAEDGGRRLIVGRETKSNLVISNPGVSREHAEVNYDSKGGVFEVRDLNSKNGTWVRSLRSGEVMTFLNLLCLDRNTVVAKVIKKMLRAGEIEAWTVDQSDWMRKPGVGKAGMRDIARTWLVNEWATVAYDPSERTELAGRAFTYVVNRRGELVLGDKGKSPREVGIKHRQLGRIVERRQMKNEFILAGQAVFDRGGEGVIIDNKSGSFFRLKQCADRKIMQRLVGILALKWGIRVTYKNIDEGGREVFEVSSERN